jgi:hypothetical protein
MEKLSCKEVQNGDYFNGIWDLWEIIEGIEEAPSLCVDANMKKAYKNRVKKMSIIVTNLFETT